MTEEEQAVKPEQEKPTEETKGPVADDVVEDVEDTEEPIKVAEGRKGDPLKIVLADVTKFRESLSAISKLIAEAELNVAPEGIELKAMDPANVAMVLFKMKSAAFVEYDVPEADKFGLKLGDLNAILKRIGKDDIVTIEFGQKISIRSLGKSKKEFTMPIIELDEKAIEKVPELKFEAKIGVDTNSLNEAFEDMALVGESCHFNIKDKKFVISAEGDNLRSAEVDMNEATVEAEVDVESRYSLEYLKHMIAKKMSSRVTVSFSKNYPLRMDYNDETVELSVILAPRVENSD